MNKLSLYKCFIDMKNEIEKHKWIESEKVKNDVGFEYALTDWVQNHRIDFVNNINLNRKPNDQIK